MEKFLKIITPRRATFGIVIILTAGALFWIGNQSRLTINVVNPSGSDQISISLTRTGSSKQSSMTSTSKTINRLLGMGSYEVLVRQNETSYFAVIKTNGFFRKTTVSAELRSESARSFVGDNPGPCMTYNTDRLISYTCGDLYTQARVHVPATTTQPTYVLQNPSVSSSAYGQSVGIVKTSEGNLALVQTSAPTIGKNGRSYQIFRVGSTLQPIGAVNLSDLDSNKTYGIKAFKSGFIVYDSGLSQVLYYAAMAAKPEKISIDQPKNKNLREVTLETSGDTIIALFTPEDGDGVRVTRLGSEIIIKSESQTKHLSFGKVSFSSVILCGANTLCTLAKNEFQAYDVGGKKPKALFGISDVLGMRQTPSSLVVIREKETVHLDVSKRQGYVGYSFGEYVFGGTDQDDFSEPYVLRIEDKQNRYYALRINPGDSDSSALDKKLLELRSLPQIKSLSIYGNTIFISPNLGELTYNEALGSFDYDAVVKKTVNDKIDQAIATAGIDTKIYTVINPFK